MTAPVAPGAAASPAPDLRSCSGLPLAPDAGGEDAPVFAEPWQAQAFAMTLQLHQRGLFSWPEWAAALSRQIRADEAHTAVNQPAGSPGDDAGQRYWQQWLAALEQLVVEKNASSTRALHDMADAWARAAHRTPHGQAVTLEPDDHPG